ELLQLELAVGRGDSQRAASLAAALAKAPPDPGLAGPLRACLAEQALDAGNLAAAAGEVLDGLAALAGTGWAGEGIRLLGAGARGRGSWPASRPGPPQPGRAPPGRPGSRRLSPPLPWRGPSPRPTVGDSPPLPRSGRWPPPSMSASARPMTRPAGAPSRTHGG